MVGQRLLERGTLSVCPLRGSQLSQRESQGRFAPQNDTAKLPFRKAVGQSREAHCDYPTKVAPPLQTVLKACPMESVVADSAKVELTMKNITTSP